MRRKQPLFSGTVVGVTDTLLFTSPDAVITGITKLTFTNYSASTCWISVYLVDFGGSPASSNQVTKERALGPGETWLCLDVIGHELDPGDMLYAIAQTATSITAKAAGVLKG